jgi:hypothetical protein
MDWTVFTEFVVAIKWPVTILIIIFVVLRKKKGK